MCVGCVCVPPRLENATGLQLQHMIFFISVSAVYYTEPTGRDEWSVAHSDFKTVVSHVGLKAQTRPPRWSRFTGPQTWNQSCGSLCRTRKLNFLAIKDLTLLCTPLEIFVLIWRKWRWLSPAVIQWPTKEKKGKKSTFTNELLGNFFLPAAILWQTNTPCTYIHTPLFSRCMKAVCCMDSLTSHMQITFPHAAQWLACHY